MRHTGAAQSRKKTEREERERRGEERRGEEIVEAERDRKRVVVEEDEEEEEEERRRLCTVAFTSQKSRLVSSCSCLGSLFSLSFLAHALFSLLSFTH